MTTLTTSPTGAIKTATTITGEVISLAGYEPLNSISQLVEGASVVLLAQGYCVFGEVAPTKVNPNFLVVYFHPTRSSISASNLIRNRDNLYSNVLVKQPSVLPELLAAGWCQHPPANETPAPVPMPAKEAQPVPEPKSEATPPQITTTSTKPARKKVPEFTCIYTYRHKWLDECRLPVEIKRLKPNGEMETKVVVGVVRQMKDGAWKVYTSHDGIGTLKRGEVYFHDYVKTNSDQSLVSAELLVDRGDMLYRKTPQGPLLIRRKSSVTPTVVDKFLGGLAVEATDSHKDEPPLGLKARLTKWLFGYTPINV